MANAVFPGRARWRGSDGPGGLLGKRLKASVNAIPEYRLYRHAAFRKRHEVNRRCKRSSGAVTLAVEVEVEASEGGYRGKIGLGSITMAQHNQPDPQIASWLKTLGIELLFQWDVLAFVYRHQSSLVSTGHIARLLGHETGQVSAALDSLKSSGLVACSRASQEVRLYQLNAPADPTRRDALEGLMTLGDRHAVRLALGRRLRGSDQPDQNQHDFPLHGVRE